MRLRKRKERPNYHYSNQTFVRSAYKKALLVIDSCEKEDHLNGAEKFINNFLMHFSKQIAYRTFETDPFYLEMFDRLKKKLLQKKLDLGW